MPYLENEVVTSNFTGSMSVPSVLPSGLACLCPPFRQGHAGHRWRVSPLALTFRMCGSVVPGLGVGIWRQEAPRGVREDGVGPAVALCASSAGSTSSSLSDHWLVRLGSCTGSLRGSPLSWNSAPSPSPPQVPNPAIVTDSPSSQRKGMFYHVG